MAGMDGRDWRVIGLGAAGALAVFAVLFFLVGGEEILSALTSANPALVVLVIIIDLCWLVAWGLMLRAVLRTLGIVVSVRRSFFVYAAAVFSNNITPFGQAGGEPVAALLISRVSDARYETGLAGIASLDALNFVPSIVFVLLGTGYYATFLTLGDRLQFAVTGAVALSIAIPLVVVVVWRYRYALAERFAPILASLARQAGRFRERWATTDAEGVFDRIERFFGHLELIATNRSRLAVALGFSSLGWLCQVVALFVAFVALGHPVAFYVLLFVIPLANLAGITPLPGGLGSIEATFVALLIPTTGAPAGVITAAVLIHRAGVYWIPSLIGGGSMAAYGGRVYNEG